MGAKKPDAADRASALQLTIGDHWRRLLICSVNLVVVRFGACDGGRADVEQGRRKTNQRLLMSTPILDPSLPADNSPEWLRVERKPGPDDFQSTPQTDVEAMADKLDELINTLNA